MKYGLLLVSGVIILFCVCLILFIGQTPAPGNQSTGMAIIEKVPVNENLSVDKEKIADCVRYCLDLNKDSSKHLEENWLVNAPNFCVSECSKIGVKCIAVLQNGDTCDVKCNSNASASCIIK